MSDRPQLPARPDVPLLGVRRLTFRYEGGRTVLRDLTFDLKAGECVLVAGPNGAGKSTLLYILAGLVPTYMSGEYHGEVFTGDAAIVSGPGHGGGIALVQQNPDAQIVTTRVDEEIAFAPCNMGLDRSEVIGQTERALVAFGLADRHADSPDQLSFGLKQRLVTASIAVLRPNVLMLDEPLSNADRDGRESVLKLLRGLKNEGRTLMIVSHELGPFVRIADRILLLSSDGRLIRDGVAVDVAEDADLLRSFGVAPAVPLPVEGHAGLRSNSRVAAYVHEAMASLAEERMATAKVALSKNSQPTILEVDHVTFVHRNGRVVLEDLALSVRMGECFGIVGRNGAGKSTLLRLCAGLLRPTKGRIMYGGSDLRTLSAAQISQRIGCVLQDPDTQLLYANTVREEIMSGPLVHLTTDAADVILSAVGIGHLADRFPGSLSFGEKKKLLIAAAMARSPAILLLDEPFFSLDARGHDDLITLVRSLTKDGLTVVLVSHDLDNMLRATDRIAVIDSGRLVLCGDTVSVLRDRRLRRFGLREATLLRFGELLGIDLPVDGEQYDGVL